MGNMRSEQALVIVEFVHNHQPQTAPQPRPTRLSREHHVMSEIGIGQDYIRVVPSVGSFGQVRIAVRGGNSHARSRFGGRNQRVKRGHLVRRERLSGCQGPGRWGDA